VAVADSGPDPLLVSEAFEIAPLDPDEIAEYEPAPWPLLANHPVSDIRQKVQRDSGARRELGRVQVVGLFGASRRQFADEVDPFAPPAPTEFHMWVSTT
jgi:hypothetical protein